MRMLHRTLVIVALSGFSLSACQTKPAPLADAEDQKMRDMVAEFDKAVLAGNWPKVVSFYSVDGILLPPNAPAVQGRAAMQKFFEQFPKITEFKEDVPEFEGHGDLAYARGTYEMTMMPPGAKTPVKDKGKTLAIWRRQGDGSWLVTRVSWTSDLAPPR